MDVRMKPRRSSQHARARQRPRRPSGPANLSKPDSPTPPNGSDCDRYVVPSRSLTEDMPALRRAATALARAVEPAKAQDERPKPEEFAFATASSSDAVGSKTHMMGPKISSVAMRAVMGTSTSTVGGKKLAPSCSGGVLPRESTRAPRCTASSTNPASRFTESEPMVTAPQSTVASSFEEPAFNSSATFLMRARKPLYTRAPTKKRSGPAQFWPMDWKTPLRAIWAMRSSSLSPTSSQTTKGSLPPSSKTTGVSVSAAWRMTSLPTCGEPTKMTLSAPPPTSAAPVGP
mmetsp:Transcript_22471/g.67438  ORF Transcript_22471/g.67438 Transcript_22471/m.67438 type:complete len:288 (-) Transcript_22471:1036-1899(-)